MGDPAGIGPEIIIQAFQDGKIFREGNGVVIGDAAILRARAARFTPGLNILIIPEVESARFDPGVLEVIDLENVPPGLPTGQASAAGGKAAIDYIRLAAELAQEGRICAMTTAPISKKGINLAGLPYPGHTEYLAEITRTDDFSLMMIGGKLRVALVTNHVPLQKVSAIIDKDLVARVIRLTHQWLCRFVTRSPKIAVTGLNPHCGEEGILGEEEATAIDPAVAQTRAEGIGVTGPHPADSLFQEARHGAYDAVVAMYHDQGLTPVKMDSMGRAVNLTMGLPIIRTSVDHGTAYGIAGKGMASTNSLVEAFKTAILLSQRSEELQAGKIAPTVRTL